MTVIQKIPNQQQTAQTGPVKSVSPVVTPVALTPLTGTVFRVQTSRITKDNETYIKSKGAFKMRIENKGQVGITIFSSCAIPSYGEETFEVGDPTLVMADDTSIEYDAHQDTDTINLVITLYFR